MFRRFSFALVLFFALCFSLAGQVAVAQTSRVADHWPHEKNCLEKMDAAMESFVVAEKAQYRDANVERWLWMDVAKNDLTCSGPEWTGNVVILYQEFVGGQKSSHKKWYGIFHIRFLSDGTFQSATSIKETAWTPTQTLYGWWGDWCGFLKTNYPLDHQKTCVSTPDPMPKKP